MGGGGQWVYGVILSLTGCAMSNFGVNVQKLGHKRLEQGKSVSLVKDPVWIAGMACVLLGSICDLFSFSFADMSLLAPLGAMTLVINMFIAPCFLKEKLTKRDIAFTCVILAGTTLSIAFGPKSAKTYSSKELLEMYEQATFIVFFVIFCMWFFATVYALKKVKARMTHGSLPARYRQFRAFAYPCIAGSFGAFSVLFAKSAGELVQTTIAGENEFKYFATWLICFLMVGSLVLQMKLLNQGLHYADALFVVPVYQVCWVIFNCIVGMVYFRDDKTLEPHEMTLFSIGVAVTLFGVYHLSKRDSGDATEPKKKRKRRKISARKRAQTKGMLGVQTKFAPAINTGHSLLSDANFVASDEMKEENPDELTADDFSPSEREMQQKDHEEGDIEMATFDAGQNPFLKGDEEAEAAVGLVQGHVDADVLPDAVGGTPWLKEPAAEVRLGIASPTSDAITVA